MRTLEQIRQYIDHLEVDISEAFASGDFDQCAAIQEAIDQAEAEYEMAQEAQRESEQWEDHIRGERQLYFSKSNLL